MAGTFGITKDGVLIGLFEEKSVDDPSVKVVFWEPPEDLKDWLEKKERVWLAEGEVVDANGLDDLDVLHVRALMLRGRGKGIDTVLDRAPEDRPKPAADEGAERSEFDGASVDESEGNS